MTNEVIFTERQQSLLAIIDRKIANGGKDVEALRRIRKNLILKAIRENGASNEQD